MTLAIPRRPLGATGLMLPELGFGAAPLGNLYRAIPDPDARATLAAALHGGLRYFDTAPYYGFGLSERRIGDAVRGTADVVISTKVGRLLRPAPGRGIEERHGFRSPLPFEPEFDYTHDGILRSHEASLQRLGLARIDLLLVHDIGAETHRANHPRRLAELRSGGLDALERLKAEGTIAAYGIGVNETAIACRLLDEAPLDAILLAGRYTLLEQDALDSLFPRARAAGTAIIVGGPYNSGILAAPIAGRTLHYNYGPAPKAMIVRARRIEAICTRHEVPVGAAALQFVLAHPLVASVIPGMAGVGEVEETLARYRAAIPDALWEELRAEDLLHSEAPLPIRVAA